MFLFSVNWIEIACEQFSLITVMIRFLFDDIADSLFGEIISFTLVDFHRKIIAIFNATIKYDLRVWICGLNSSEQILKMYTNKV